MLSLEVNRQDDITVFTGHVGCVIQGENGVSFAPALEKFSQTESRRKPGGFELHSATGTESLDNMGVFLVNCLNDPDPSVVINGLHLSYALYGPFSDQGMQGSLPHVIYNLGEPTRQKQLGMVSIHAAAMESPDGIGVLVLGDKGAGKTTTSLMLALEHEYKMIGNDLVIIQNSGPHPKIISGSQKIDIRIATLNKYSQLLSRIETTLSNKTDHGHENKTTLLPESIGIEVSKKPCEIGLVVRTSSHPDAQHTFVSEVANPITERLRLNENMARYIRGLATPLLVTRDGIRGYFPSLDDEHLNAMRNHFVDILLSTCLFKYISAATPYEIADEIDGIVKHL